MIKIGDFAKIFDVSINTIRFYEEKGLLVPAYVDNYSGYRYYDEKNISDMSKILFLKDLNLSLDEIRTYDDSKIENKIKEYENEILKIKENINTLNLIEQKGGIDNMDMFINDERVIGKWKLVAISNSKEDYYENKYLDDDFSIKELYLMENGKKYWVISWTKGYIIINGNKNPYELEDDLMFVKVYGIFDNSEYKYAVYKKIDNKNYDIEDFAIKDDTNFDYEPDNKLVGNWQAIDFVYNEEQFMPNKKYWKYDLALDKLSVYADGNVLISYNSDEIKKTKYTKGFIANIILNDTLCKYFYRVDNNKTYLFIEWKNGDYIYSNQVPGYYVFEKIN